MTGRRRDLIAQWAYDTRSILGRFHLWLDDVEERFVQGGRPDDDDALSFAGAGLEKGFILSAAVTALGTRLFGRFGEGADTDKQTLNRVKKDADAVSAYALSEALWYLTRHLPENHAVMVSLGEGLMPKAGESPEMGSNPLLGFGRVYARPQVATYLDERVHRLINTPGYEWEDFWNDIESNGLTVWGAAIDTLENTSRFARGADLGSLTVLHLFDQPLAVARPYEGYMGTLVLPRRVVEEAAGRSVLIDYRTPRKLVLEAILSSYEGLEPENIHVWTLGGSSRIKRIGYLWNEWKELGVHLVQDDDPLPTTGMPAFIDSGTYAPTFIAGPFTQDGKLHFFLVDGYAASAEAIQAASLDPILDLESSLCIFSSKFEVSANREANVMALDPEADDFRARLEATLGIDIDEKKEAFYREDLRVARAAGMPLDRRTATIDDFFPRKKWRLLAVAGYMLPDPYTGAAGIEDLGEGRYRVTTRAATRLGMLEVVLTLRLMETFEESRLVFSPLLDRFYRGQDYQTRPVKISDSGRIRNELQTLVSEAIEPQGEGRIRIHFDRVDDAVLPADKKVLIQEVLAWYKQNHPIWFKWLDM
jgi:hypothetical protein